jgi:hypothetical protein
MDYLNPIIYLDIFFAIVAAYIMTRLPARAWLKYLLIPIIVCTTYYHVSTFHNVLGHAYKAEPEGDFELVTHRVIRDKDGKKFVQMLVIQKDVARFYEFKYSARLDQIMTAMKDKKLKGHRLIMNLRKKKNGNHGDQDDDYAEGGDSEISIRPLGKEDLPAKEPLHFPP